MSGTGPAASGGLPGRCAVRRRRAVRRRAAGIVLAGALWAGTVPSAAAAPTPAPSGGAAAPPDVTQTRPDVQRTGCLQPSDRTADGAGWARAELRPEDAWPVSRGAGVTVAVVGSGVDAGAPALAGRLQLGPRLTGSGDAGRDCVGYGTFAAGLVAGRGADGAPAGLAPDARVLAVAVTDDAGTTTPDLLGAGIRAAVDRGARVVAVVVPVPGPSDALSAAVAYAAAHGVLVVAPVGPDARGTGSAPVFPASYPGVLAVAAVGSGGSATGVPDGRVDLSAPGLAVTGPGLGGGVFTASGPGCATAHVAGAAALLLALRPDLTPEQLIRRLEATAYHPGGRLPDAAVGYGEVDPVAAVTASWSTAGPGPAAAPPVIPPGPDRSGDRRALAVAGGSAGLVLLVGLGALAARLGRRRGRADGGSPASRPTPSAPSAVNR
ncbi:S8 family serine peptidase [Kitasatospora sp. NPDC089797]|uniref:S8 family serine peptidase n=1 Tax=Kitasatospora sp. NPDC089797 TaxID=3155298 RepID=UPI00341E8C76